MNDHSSSSPDPEPTASTWTAKDVAKALGGETDRYGVLAPRFNHRPHDRSLRVMIGPQFPHGYYICLAYRADSNTYDIDEEIAHVLRCCPFLPARGTPVKPLTDEERKADAARQAENERKLEEDRARTLDYYSRL